MTFEILHLFQDECLKSGDAKRMAIFTTYINNQKVLINQKPIHYTIWKQLSRSNTNSSCTSINSITNKCYFLKIARNQTKQLI